ncbi:thioredoxin family protein [Crassaminicella thermophila]|uniref:Thioredoxin family protein n=1 Tax=Crassaminicella thermophila TaxID=2599308 RepID=A0A5C0SAD2_CRATE|nr:thioredoxin family protein [Crassaminicella thermophila]QEK11111.1 thioredoxin family protein [Crassaminicella thermophila]
MNIQALFKKGLSFMDFVNKDKDTYKEKTLEVYNNIVVDEALEKEIKKVNQLTNVLVFAEIWCPDCMINVPALQKIADINPNFIISIVSREGNEIFMDNYKVNGKPKIPTFVIMDKDFYTLGAFIEQPQVLKEIEAKGKQVEIIVAKRKYRKGEYAIETIKEVLNIVKK